MAQPQSSDAQRMLLNVVDRLFMMPLREGGTWLNGNHPLFPA
jgi:hypothetical protein